MPSNARRRFGRVSVSKDYKLMHHAGSNFLRVATGALLHQCADFETLSVVPQVMRDLEIPNTLAVTASRFSYYLGLGPSAGEGIVQSVFESMVTSKWIFNFAETFVHEALLAQRA